MLFDQRCITPAKVVFNSFEYATAPPRKARELPGTLVMRSATSPPVQLSATASVAPFMPR